jgi:putative ABC transport system permease protein
MSKWTWLSRRRRDQELDEEIQAHLAMAARDRIERGDTPQAAELAVRREFGNRTVVQEVTREMWGWSSLERLWQDIRYALRTMRRSPGFTAVAVLSLALGIGANTAIFSLIDTLMLRSLPVREPGQLVDLLNTYPGDPRLNVYSFDAYQYMRDRNQVFSGLIACSPARLSVRGEGLEAAAADGEFVDGNYFRMLGVKPTAGRLIGPEDDGAQAASSAVAVVSWSYWKSRFNLDPAIMGKRIIIDDVPATIAGVAPQGFSGIVLGYRTQVWVTMSTEPAIHHATRHGGVSLMGRLKPGVSMEQARAEMAVLYRQTFDEASLKRDPNWSRVKFDLEPAGAGLSRADPPGGRLRDRFSKPLLFLMAVVGLLLLIACTNVASMLLARAAGRRREMALRISLGAGRLRLVRQVLTESLLLSVTGGLCGVLVAYFGADALVRIIASERSRIEIVVQPDMHMLLFTAGAALLTGVLFGLAPALHAMAAEPASSLRTMGTAGETRLGRLFGRSLVVAQVALSVVLLSAAGLFIRHLSDLRNVNLGFQRDHLLLATLNPARSGYTGEQLSSAYRELLERFVAIPGVRSATLSSGTPISGAAASRFATVEGYQKKAVETRIFVRWVAPRYFETYGTPLLAGRDFTLQDLGAAHLAILNRAMARYYFGDANPVGRRVTLERDDQPFEIAGVVGDAKYIDLREPAPRTIYLCAFQARGVNSHSFSLRTNGDPAVVAGEVRRTVGTVLKTVPVESITTLAAQMDASIVPERLIATLSALFGALGSLLAAIGVYGLLAYTVARRINEIGIRMALGATRGDVIGMVVGDALRMVSIGLGIGVPMALWGRRFAASVMEGLPLASPVPIAFGAVAMIAIAMLAAYVPARRAARVDPMVALRYE